ncbi:MAG TPA: MBG domain-containing protein, partial [Burkholderiaceae bacterium]
PSLRPAGVANLPLTGTLEGYVNGDVASSTLAGTARWSTAATPASAPGRYAVEGYGLRVVNPNYVLAQDPRNATALQIVQGLEPIMPSAMATTRLGCWSRNDVDVLSCYVADAPLPRLELRDGTRPHDADR